MQKKTNLTLANGILTTLLVAIFALTPFSGIAGPKFLGQLALYAYIYPVFLLILFSFSDFFRFTVKHPFAIWLFSGFVALNFVLNNSEILSTQYFGVTALSKYFNMLAVLIFHILFCIACARVISPLTRVGGMPVVMIAVFYISAFMCLVWSFEIVSWLNSLVRVAFLEFRSLVSSAPTFSPGRIAGVSYEPSFNAILISGLFPLLFAYMCTLSRTSWRFAACMAMVVFFIAASLLSGSRTAYIAISFELIIALSFIFKINKIAGVYFYATTFCLAFVVTTLYYPLAIYLHYDHQSLTSLSDATRLTSIKAQISAWWSSPFFGVGFGQFPFHFPQFVDLGLGGGSYEITHRLKGEMGPKFLPSYNLNWAILAECGLAGFFMFYGVASYAYIKISKRLMTFTERSEYWLDAAIFTGLCGALTVGLSFGGFQQPFLWFYLAAALSRVSSKSFRSKKDIRKWKSQ